MDLSKFFFRNPQTNRVSEGELTPQKLLDQLEYLGWSRQRIYDEMISKYSISPSEASNLSGWVPEE